MLVTGIIILLAQVIIIENNDDAALCNSRFIITKYFPTFYCFLVSLGITIDYINPGGSYHICIAVSVLVTV